MSLKGRLRKTTSRWPRRLLEGIGKDAGGRPRAAGLDDDTEALGKTEELGRVRIRCAVVNVLYTEGIVVPSRDLLLVF